MAEFITEPDLPGAYEQHQIMRARLERVEKTNKAMLIVLAEHSEITSDGQEHDEHCPCLQCRTYAAIALCEGAAQ